MKNLKKIFNIIMYPHIALLVLLAVLSAVSLVLSFGFFPDDQIINYCSYVLSAYTLTAICFRIPRIVKKARSIKDSNKYLSIYSKDPRTRINISLIGLSVYNAAYALFQLGLGISGSSLWYYSLAAYYFLLSLMRIAMFTHTAKHRPSEMMFREQLIYRMCGIGLLLMTAALTVIINYVIDSSRSNVQNEIITITMAAFTFTSLTIAIVNVIRYRKYNSPVWSASKILSFVSAIVSMLTLEDAMLAAFGEGEGDSFRQTITSVTGWGIAAVTIAIAVFMIIDSTKKIREHKNPNGEYDEQQ